MKRLVPRLKTDAAVEAFLESDLSDLDFSQFKSGRLRIQKQSSRRPQLGNYSVAIDSEWQLSNELRDFICDLPGPGSLSWSAGADSSTMWVVSLSDKTGTATQASFNDLKEAVEWLRNKGIEFYPDSDFSKDYSRLLDDDCRS